MDNLNFVRVGASVLELKVADTIFNVSEIKKQNSSETALDEYAKFDYTIANIHTLKEYEANVIEVLKREGF